MFSPLGGPENLSPKQLFVIDGESFLHKVILDQNASLKLIWEKYMSITFNINSVRMWASFLVDTLMIQISLYSGCESALDDIKKPNSIDLISNSSSVPNLSQEKILGNDVLKKKSDCMRCMFTNCQRCSCRIHCLIL